MYADIIALCQFLPGPASSQVGISIGILRGGLLGGIVSFIGFTLPSIIVLVIFALLYQNFSLEGAIFIQSLKVVAVSVVLHARSEEHTSELQSRGHLVCRLLLEKKMTHK